MDFDLWYGESDADRYVGEAISILREKGLLCEDGGAQIVSVSEEGDKAQIPPAIIIKSDGAINYQTTDIATILQRKLDFSPDKIWYVVDKRQELHFTQVFRVSKKAGIAEEKTELEHLSFGTMNGLDGKPVQNQRGESHALVGAAGQRGFGGYGKIEGLQLRGGRRHKGSRRKDRRCAIKFGDMINQNVKDYVVRP